MENKNSKAINTSRMRGSKTAGKSSPGIVSRGNHRRAMLEHLFLFVQDEVDEVEEKNKVPLKSYDNENSI